MLLVKLTQSIDSSFAIFFLVLPHMWIACTENAFYNIFSLALRSVLVVFLEDYLYLMDFVMVYQYAKMELDDNFDSLFKRAVPALNQAKTLSEIVYFNIQNNH
ncbi:hypothetical protein [Paraglaciecola marina]|uniref:hypothetical protein n=1 Tax=Paraglaciecola marina TaxID=2500157 RepID=UPI00105DB2C7|nr:hypothetical protein [Paraglaciecola marina]